MCALFVSKAQVPKMDSRGFYTEAGRLILYSMYPLYILYTNFVFLGLFILDPKVLSDAGVLVLFVVFNVLQTFIIIYYILIFSSDSKSTQDIFPMTPERRIERNFDNINPFIVETLQKGSIERTHVCSICQTYKPPRCHHCSRCNKCYLKMDHHCLFLDVCIGFHNYKFFIQFLATNIIFNIFYITILDVDTAASPAPLTTEAMVNFIVSTALSGLTLLVMVVTLIFHLMLISSNETTIEKACLDAYLTGNHTYIHVFQEGPVTQLSESKNRRILNPYNLGIRENWREVFGMSIWDWFSPSFTSRGDGIGFRKNNMEDDNSIMRF